VIRRFQIEDLIVQDSSGVVFRALDTETGKTVAVRRFFPFGADGGGLQADEQTAYNIAVSRLAGISHPALRAVICGGCDPVDGMPFIATEWIEGEPLLPFVQEQPLAAQAAAELIGRALEVCELLSHVLAEEAVWLETDLQTIIVGNPESGREVTFWISPLKWLGGDEENRGLESIITLTEELMGWKGRLVSDQAGRGLGGWLKWLRGAAAATTLHEAREMLAASIGEEPPEPAKALVAKATALPLKRPIIKQASSKAPFVVLLCFALVVAGVGTWFLIRQRGQNESSRTSQNPPGTVPATKLEPAKASKPPVPKAVADVNERAAELSAQSAARDENKEAILAEQQAEADKNGGVIQWNHNELLISKDKSEVVVGGVFENIDFSKTKKMMYIMFARRHGDNLPRGTIELKRAPKDLTEANLKPLIGKKIRIRGVVRVQKGLGQMRPEIIVKDRASIEVLD
jgi:hypothetical protein